MKAIDANTTNAANTVERVQSSLVQKANQKKGLADSIDSSSIGSAKESVMHAFAAVQPGLTQVEERIRQALPSDASELTDIARYLLELGGKRIRPVLSLLSARMFGLVEANEKLIDVAAGIELIHMATLLHDDIIDESPVRRRKESAYARFGLSSTLLTGDFLLVKAFGICAKLDRFIIESTEEACVALTEGEILEGTLNPSRDLRVADYLRVIEKKTASLFSLAAGVGAHLAGQPPEHVACLQKFGNEAGIVFQMVDDILDITANEDLLGKPTGMDLRQKTPSLINILWLEHENATAKEFFAQPEVALADAQQVAQALKESEVVEHARTIAADYARRAISTLQKIPADNVDEYTREQLFALIEYTRERCL